MFTTNITPAFLDTDGLGHINNTKLPMWFELARNDLFRIFTPDLDMKKWELIVAKIEVDFKGEMHFGFDVEIKTFIEKIGNSSFVVLQQAWQKGKLTAEGKTYMVHYDFAQKKTTPLTQRHKLELALHLVEENTNA